MSENKILEISTDKGVFSISIETCNRERDGHIIRELTRENFYDSLIKTIGWNENTHRKEPRFPERYLMLFCHNHCIGFLSLRDRFDCLYLETLQLVQHFRGRGIGTSLLKFVEEIADSRKKSKIQLRLFKDNLALSLYRRTGFKVVEDEEWCLLMEKVLNT